MQVLEGHRAGIAAYLGDGGDVVVPPVMRDLPVTVIGEEAFAETEVASLVIP